MARYPEIAYFLEKKLKEKQQQQQHPKPHICICCNNPTPKWVMIWESEDLQLIYCKECYKKKWSQKSNN